jgi:serine protease Do
VVKDLPQNVNFAIKSSIVELFLQTHGVHLPTDRRENKELEPADVADIAKSISVAIECRPN